MNDAFAPARLGPLTLRNRIIKAATFEGLTAKHVVSDALIEFHREMAAGGVGLTTVAYCAVSREGCGTPTMSRSSTARSRAARSGRSEWACSISRNCTPSV